jgi:hypothetical protein
MTAAVDQGAPFAPGLSVDYPKRLSRFTTLLRVVWVLPIAVGNAGGKTVVTV